MLIFVVHPTTRLSDVISPASARVVAIIPARYSSTRFPGKPLADIGGRPMVEHVYRRAEAAASVESVVVATDDARVVRAVNDFGGLVQLSKTDHVSGTDRLAEVAEALRCELVVNLQVDEPLIDPAAIDAAVASCADDASIMMSTLRCPLQNVADLHDPNVVKVAVDHNGYALCFSRAAIGLSRTDDRLPSTSPVDKHIGLYVYRRPFLLTLAHLDQTPLELAEQLEQMRALEHGHRIMTTATNHDSIGVDTPAELEHVRRLVADGVLHE